MYATIKWLFVGFCREREEDDFVDRYLVFFLWSSALDYGNSPLYFVISILKGFLDRLRLWM